MQNRRSFLLSAPAVVAAAYAIGKPRLEVLDIYQLPYSHLYGIESNKEIVFEDSWNGTLIHAIDRWSARTGKKYPDGAGFDKMKWTIGSVTYHKDFPRFSNGESYSA